MDPNTNWPNSYAQGVMPGGYQLAAAGPAPIPAAPPEPQYAPAQPLPQMMPIGAPVVPPAPIQPIDAYPAAMPQQAPITPQSPAQPPAQAWSSALPAAAPAQPVPGYGYPSPPSAAVSAAPQLPVAPAASWSAPQPSPQPVPAAPPSAPIASEQSLKRLRRKVIGSIVAVAAFMTIGAVAALVITNMPATYSKSDLDTYSSDGVTFQYPKEWLALDSLPQNAQIGFGDNADVNKALGVIMLTVTDEHIGPVTGATAQQISTFQADLSTELASTLFQDSLKHNTGCSTIDSSNTTNTPASFSLIGVHFDFTCTRPGQGGVRVKGYLGVAPSNGKIYTFEVVAQSALYEANAAVFDGILDGLEVQ